ncbi:MAG TPA: ABC transporter permease [Gammaproteobacteria bacterium]|nr:ABC transporter permease [Gammaproteobacteria bacterium]
MALGISRLRATLVDNVLRDLRYASRSFSRTPLVALTIVTTVGLGLGLVAVAFTILNAYLFLADDVRNPYELFAVQHQASANAAPQGFTHLEYEALVRETAIFSEAFASTPADAYIDGSRQEGVLVTGNFFGVLGVSAARGRALTPEDDAPGAPAVLVISHRAWSQVFASDPGIVGRTVRLNGTPFDVVGIMPEHFRGLRPVAAPEFWAPLSRLRELRPGEQGGEGAVRLDIVGRLRSDLTPDQALAQLLTWDSVRAAERSAERRETSLVLEPRPGTVPLSADVLALVVPLFFAFGLILVIGCANVANLLLARAVARQREIGIRLSIGASRRRIVSQLLTESLLLALGSAALAFGIARVVLKSAIYAVTSTFPPELGDISVQVPAADWRVAVFLIVGAVVSTIFFALAPALQATRVELVRAMHGEVLSGTRPGRMRAKLVTLQVAASVLLLICAAIFLQATLSSASVDPGIRTSDVVTANILNEQRRAAVLDIVRSDTSVAAVAAARPGLLGGFPASAEGATKSTATFQFVSPEYFGVLGIDIVRGRGFTEIERGANDTVAIVSETAARELWPDLDAIGQVVRVESDPEQPAAPELGPVPTFSRSLVVVGVARDVPGFRLGGFRIAGAGIYVPISAESDMTSLLLRVEGNAERARFALIDRLAAIDPNMAQVSTLQTFARAEAYLLGIPFWLTLVLGALALFLTLSGLFSVLSYVVEQRMREFGVRAALGATRARIGMLVLSQSARPVGVGILLGAGLTAGFAGLLLATPAAEAIGATVRPLDPLAYAAAVLCVVAACACAALVPALRAGRIDPIAALRQD